MWFLKRTEEQKWVSGAIFNSDECKIIVDSFKNKQPILNTIIGSNQITSNDIRKSSIIWLSETDGSQNWIYEKCSNAINSINEEFFKYDLTYIETMQYTTYNQDGRYKMHVDNLFLHDGFRKLSFSINLSSPDSYDGGDLMAHYRNTPDYLKRDLGFINVFPSSLLHEVSPVTRGVRNTLVGWCCGPRFR